MLATILEILFQDGQVRFMMPESFVTVECTSSWRTTLSKKDTNTGWGIRATPVNAGF
ncbi:hypothetical protein DPMN_036209 [Dreissena polymorpha]|uniref:Uncharacterized protein n=1 Tax=Dreissena polymorpha TaxID=45954 RepID=A0A9D4RNN9_DREPO|nr:hypothetical protein DPMN_036209 [Dreissena polymorpha]